jgi:23S rRNA pseudouridine2605 synthase
VVTTADDELGRPTVLDFIPTSTRLYPVGRLDIDSEGLVLLTNDGELANQLSHPRFEHPKEYRVLVARQPDLQQLEAFRHGVVMPDGYRTAPAEVRIESTRGKGAWLNVVLHEGRKRQIRETCMQIGLPIVRIIRVRIGSLRLGDLKPREWRNLTPAEVRTLKEPAVKPRKPAPREARVTRPPRSSGAPKRPSPKKGKIS